MAYSELVLKQRKYFKTGITRPYEFRVEQLQKLKKVLIENDSKIYDAIYKDLRRPADQTKYMEFDRTIAEIDYALEHLKEWIEPIKKQPESYGTPWVYKEPLGVVLIISPFNFPATLALRPLINALTAGNTVILKPSEVAENTANSLADILNSNFDDNYVTVVQGEVQATIDLLNERFDHIFYTGSPGVARSIMAQASRHLTPVTLELGGKCPAVVLDDANLEKTVQAIVHGKFANVGQLCMATDYVLCERNIKDKFIDSLTKLIEEKYGKKAKESKAYTRIINERHFNRLQSLISNSKGKVLYKSEDGNDQKDRYIGPHIIEVQADDGLMQDELFGPILPILPIDNLNQAIEFINDREKPLNAYVFTTNEEKIERFMRETYSANAVSNGVVLNYYTMQLPFGGVGESGMGRYHGRFGFDTFTHEKSVVKGAI